MVRRSVLALVLFSTLICTSACGAWGPARPPTPEEIAEEIVVLINEERRALGLEPLVINDHLVQMAQWRSQDMIDGGYYSHYPPPGHPTLGDLCERLGHQWIHAPVENLTLLGPVDEENLDLTIAQQAVNSWKNSPGHWDWIISPYQKMTGVGVAIKDGQMIVTQLLWSGGPFTPANAEQYNREAP